MQPQQREQRGARVQVALAVRQIAVRQQHLRAAHAVLAQLRFVDLREAHLPDRCSRLQLVDLLRPRRPAEALHALRDRAARHHDHLAAFTSQGCHLPAPVADRIRIHPPTLVRDQAGADLHDDAARVAQGLAHEAGALVGELSNRGSCHGVLLLIGRGCLARYCLAGQFPTFGIRNTMLVPPTNDCKQPRSPFNEGSLAGDDGLRRVLELVTAAVCEN